MLVAIDIFLWMHKVNIVEVVCFYFICKKNVCSITAVAELFNLKSCFDYFRLTTLRNETNKNAYCLGSLNTISLKSSRNVKISYISFFVTDFKTNNLHFAKIMYDVKCTGCIQKIEILVHLIIILPRNKQWVSLCFVVQMYLDDYFHDWS